MCFLDFLAKIFGIDDDEEEVEEVEHTSKYKLKSSQLSDCEKYFFDILQKHFSKDYDIRPQVPLSSIIEKEKSFNNEYQNELNRIIDFGIFNKQTQSIILLIEINDSTHTKGNRKYRDARVSSICKDAGVSLMTFWTKYDNKEDYVVNRIKKEINNILQTK